MRKVIRQTWLNDKYWNFQDTLKIHFIFLMGVEHGQTVTSESNQYNDILQYNFIESHYNLTVKGAGAIFCSFF